VGGKKEEGEDPSTPKGRRNLQEGEDFFFTFLFAERERGKWKNSHRQGKEEEAFPSKREKGVGRCPFLLSMRKKRKR